MAAMATKEQEREAVVKIKKIIEDLGSDSYVGTALEGCLKDAEENIENDFALSMYGRWQCAERALEIEKAKVRELEIANKTLATANKRLIDESEQLKMWKPFEDDRNIAEAKYQQLVKAGGTKELSDDEAAELIHREFGFDISKIEIIRYVNIYEINIFRQLRKVGERRRDPLYNATDWNYVRFNVNGWAYEMHNGELFQFID